MSTTTTTERHLRRVALVGNPNAGKTTLFNALTGMRQKVGNYPGVTVEKKEGLITLSDGTRALVVDLPGIYSLTANSPDEKVATDVLLAFADEAGPEDPVVCVVDASNLERNLYLVSQIIDCGLRVIVALNMIDIAEAEGTAPDIALLSQELGVTVVPTVANKGTGIEELKNAILAPREHPVLVRDCWHLPDPVQRECSELIGLIREYQKQSKPVAFRDAVMLLSSSNGLTEYEGQFDPALLDHVRRDHEKLDFLGFDRQSIFVESRYAWIKEVLRKAGSGNTNPLDNISDRLDSILIHRVWGFVIFLGLMTLMFQMIFSWATAPMELIGDGFDALGRVITASMPEGELQSLIVDGGLSGVAAVVTFLPQILFLFFFLGLLEDTGYMARAAFIMDRVMSKVGLHGKSFIPLLSSFACAIPGIMAARTIENPKDRLATILVAPLISCSARLPVYTLLIAAFIPSTLVLGFISLPALTMLSLYLMGLLAALIMAWIFKKTLLRSAPPVFIMELPPYRMPSLKSVLLHMWERAWAFLKRAGTIILGVSIVLWFLATYPKIENATPSDQLAQSFAGQAGHLIEPIIKPLGFDWKIGIGLIGSLLQREVFVSTMGTIYNVQSDSDGSVSLKKKMQQDRNPATGKPSFSVLTALCLMVYYVLAMQCMSTLAVVRKETNSWTWPTFQLVYMSALAYGVTFLVRSTGLAIGMGG